MEEHEEYLKEKALLLLRRERELFALRTKHEQLALWLGLAQSLPELFADRRLSIADVLGRVRKTLIAGLRLQRVSFFELQGSTVRALTPEGPERPLGPEVAAVIDSEPKGFCNDPADPTHSDGAGMEAFAGVVGLSRFVWSRIVIEGRPPLLMVGGFDRSKAAFQSLFEDSDAAHFNNAAQHVQTLIANARLVADLERAKEQLEQRVRERTQELASRNRDLRLVLDNVDQALLTLDHEGRLAGERSVMVDRWFGAYEGTPTFVEHMARIDPTFAASFDVGFEVLKEGVMPRRVCLYQLPTRLRSGDRQFHVAYSPIGEGEHLAGLLVVVNDVTEQIRRAQEEAEQREMLSLFQALMRDREGYLQFTEEARAIVDQLATGSPDATTALRHLHNLKGSSAMMGARFIADLCHQAENLIQEGGIEAAREALSRLGERWAAVVQSLSSVLDDSGTARVEVSVADLEHLAEEVRGGASPERIVARLSAWSREPIGKPLQRLSDYARALAARLDKGDIRVRVDAIDTLDARVDSRCMRRLWPALVHLVRNAVDHGIEPAAERTAGHKAPHGRLDLRATSDHDSFVIEVEDDGRGIDWDRVRTLAVEQGLPHEGQDQLAQALLHPGFTTRAEVTPTSGRGVGMSAVDERVAALGGRLSVRSARGAGTCWRVTLPLSAVAPAGRPAATAAAAYSR
jgi:two-component system chemotaxis sensor kinase CheA